MRERKRASREWKHESEITQATSVLALARRYKPVKKVQTSSYPSRCTLVRSRGTSWDFRTPSRRCGTETRRRKDGTGFNHEHCDETTLPVHQLSQALRWHLVKFRIFSFVLFYICWTLKCLTTGNDTAVAARVLYSARWRDDPDVDRCDLVTKIYNMHAVCSLLLISLNCEYPFSGSGSSSRTF